MYFPYEDSHQISSKSTQFLVSPNRKQHRENHEPKAQLLPEYRTAWTDNVVKYKWEDLNPAVILPLSNTPRQ